MTQTLRPELEPLPSLMTKLPIYRGYCVPWFVDWLNGETPEFRAMNPRKWVQAVKQKLCWVCGNPLPRAGNFVFVAGPMCGINRTSSEPPSHIDCGRWSARNCPFLSNPDMVRREDELINSQSLREKASGIAITRNPGVTMLWFTREYEIFNDGNGKPLIVMGRPSGIEWYAKGQKATREEVLQSIDSGIYSLETVAKQDGDLADLQRRRKEFEEKWT